MIKMFLDKLYVEQKLNPIEEIRVFRTTKNIMIWVNIYQFDDFIEAIDEVLGSAAFSEEGMRCYVQGTWIMIDNFEQVLNLYDDEGYKKFIQCMKNRVHINFYK